MDNWKTITEKEKIERLVNALDCLAKEIARLRYESKVKIFGNQNVNFGQEVDLQRAEVYEILGIDFLI